MKNEYYIINEHLLQPFNLTLEKLKFLISYLTQKKLDFGDFYLQKIISESWILDDSVVKHGSFGIEQGIGVRTVFNGRTGFAYSDDLSVKSIEQLIRSATFLLKNTSDTRKVKKLKRPAFPRFYTTKFPSENITTDDKIALLHQINSYARLLDQRIKHVKISLTSKMEMVLILNTDGLCVMDVRPLVRLNINLIMIQGKNRQSFSAGGGARCEYTYFTKNALWKKYVEEAYQGILMNLDAKIVPSGKMPVVLGPGWPAVLLHEAVGHGLEGDFNRKKSSTFSEKIGTKVASEKCTIIDEGCIHNHCGTLNFDDEGTPTQRTVLIEDGILKSYMHDRISAKEFETLPTGNSRRQSYAHLPLPRMTNTYMLNGEDKLEDMIQSIEYGVYATHFNGGQVDITSGQFVFVMDQARLIENGQLKYPLKGASLIGQGAEIMKKISMVANDFSLDQGTGICGKEGQSIPVGVGQPSLKIDEITVGGSK